MKSKEFNPICAKYGKKIKTHNYIVIANDDFMQPYESYHQDCYWTPPRNVSQSFKGAGKAGGK